MQAEAAKASSSGSSLPSTLSLARDAVVASLTAASRDATIAGESAYLYPKSGTVSEAACGKKNQAVAIYPDVSQRWHSTLGSVAADLPSQMSQMNDFVNLHSRKCFNRMLYHTGIYQRD